MKCRLVVALRQAASKLGRWRLDDCIMYGTLEPCPMCAGAILQSRVRTVIYGASDPKGGCIESCMQMYQTKGFNHYPQVVSGVLKEECSGLLTAFFKEKRKNKNRSNT